MTAIKQSDFIRVALLSHYGGLHMDLTIVLTTDLEWLFDLKNNPDVVNKYGEQPEVFYAYSRHGSK